MPLGTAANVEFVNIEVCGRFVAQESWVCDRTAFVAFEKYLGSASDTSGDKMPGNVLNKTTLCQWRRLSVVSSG